MRSSATPPTSMSKLFLSLTGTAALLATAADGAVIDLFSEGSQLLELDANTKYISQTVALGDSPFTSRFASLYGGQQQLSVSTESAELTYSFALSNAASGQFGITYATDKGTTADLTGNGETGILFHFENINVKGPVGLTVVYYSTQWKGSAAVTLSGTKESEDVFLPFSAFPAKSGDFSKLTSLSITSKNLQPGDTLSMSSITTVPEVSSPALVALAAFFLVGRRRR